MSLNQIKKENERLEKQIKLQDKINNVQNNHRKLKEILRIKQRKSIIPDQPMRRRKLSKPKNNYWYEKKNAKFSKKKRAQIKSRYTRVNH